MRKIVTKQDGEAGTPWTTVEIEATVQTYFQMLRKQELGQAVNKAEHNRRLQALIPTEPAAPLSSSTPISALS